MPWLASTAALADARRPTGVPVCMRCAISIPRDKWPFIERYWSVRSFKMPTRGVAMKIDEYAPVARPTRSARANSRRAIAPNKPEPITSKLSKHVQCPQPIVAVAQPVADILDCIGIGIIRYWIYNVLLFFLSSSRDTFLFLCLCDYYTGSQLA